MTFDKQSPYAIRQERRVQALELRAQSMERIANTIERYVVVDLVGERERYTNAGREFWEQSALRAMQYPEYATVDEVAKVADEMLREWKRRYAPGVDVNTGACSVEELLNHGRQKEK